MSDLPKKVIEAAFDGDWQQPIAVVRRVMADSLGPDRLVVAGPHEQEIIEKVCDFLLDEDHIETTRDVARYIQVVFGAGR